MGCGNCGTGASGKPSGCKGNGGCSTGGCNRLNVFDWLNDLPLHDSAKPYSIIEVSFNKGSRKEFFRNATSYLFEKGDWLAVEGVGGYDVGTVSLTGELVKLQLKKYGVREGDVSKRVLHPATEEELEQSRKQKDREAEVLMRSRAIARTLNLEMKLCEVEIQADSKKGTFFYTADQRVDFRELIKLYAGDFKMKVEMRQIGARQESGKVGGIGSCGRELCCSTWLTDFKSVNTTAARYQNLSINQTKLSGQCGRLKCCLNYELDTYMDALSVFPDNADSLQTVKGTAHLQKRDIFKNLMWYSYSDNNKQYPLTITRVKEIVKLNKDGQKADELHPVELETKESKAGIKADVGFINDVGQITLKALEKNKKKKKPSDGNKGLRQADGNRPQRDNQQGNKAPVDKAAAGDSSTVTEGATPQQGQHKGQQGGNRQQGNRPQGNRQQGNRGQQNKPAQQADADGAVTAQSQQGGNRPQHKPQQPKQSQQPDAEGGVTAQPQQGGNRPQQNKQQQPRQQQQPKAPKPQQPQGQNKPQQSQEGQQNRPQQQPRPNRPPRPPREDRPREEKPTNTEPAS